jgi:hypothetical protein
MPRFPRPVLLGLPLLLGACAYEPWERPGTWQQTGANEANLRAMVVDPTHLTRGVAPATPSRGQPAARAVARAAAGQSSDLGTQGTGGQAGGAPAGAPGAPQQGGGMPALPAPMGNNVSR